MSSPQPDDSDVYRGPYRPCFSDSADAFVDEATGYKAYLAIRELAASH